MSDSIIVGPAGILPEELEPCGAAEATVAAAPWTAAAGLPDPRSFHVFSRQERYFCFDRATASFFEVPVETYTALSLLEHSGGEARFRQGLAASLPGVTLEQVRDALAGFSREGMFVYTPNDHGAQKAMLESLWAHRPRRVQLLMAQGCNLGCRYCYAWRNGSNQKETLMPFEVAKAAVDHLVERSGTRPQLQVTFFGGEPLLNWEVLRRVVAYCRLLRRKTGKHFTWELITNGTLLTPQVVKFLVRHRFLLFVSIDGWREMHNWNRPSMDKSDRHEEIVRNALHAHREYVRHGLPPVKVRANLTTRFHDAERVAAYLTGLGFTNVAVGAIEPLPHGDASPAALTEDEMDELHESMLRTIYRTVDDLEHGRPTTPYERGQVMKFASALEPRALKGITCGIGRNTATVDNKGKIVPCHRYEGMDNYVLGDVWHGLDRERTMAYYNRVNDNALARCHSCWVRDYCAGGCAWLLSAKDGHLADPTLRECNRRRRSVEESLYLREHLRQRLPELFPPAEDLPEEDERQAIFDRIDDEHDDDEEALERSASGLAALAGHSSPLSAAR